MPDLKQIFLYANVESGRLTDSEDYELGKSSWPVVYQEDKIIFCITLRKADGTACVLGVSDTISIFVNNTWDKILDEDGILTVGKSGAVSEIKADTFTTVPPTSGRLKLIHNDDEYEKVEYTSWTEVGGVYTFVVSTTLTYSYDIGDSCQIMTPHIASSDNSMVNISGDWDDADIAAGKISVRVYFNTVPYRDRVGNNEEISDCKLELVKYNSGNPSRLIQDGITCRNIVDDELSEPVETDSSYSRLDSRYSKICTFPHWALNAKTDLDEHEIIEIPTGWKFYLKTIFIECASISGSGALPTVKLIHNFAGGGSATIWEGQLTDGTAANKLDQILANYGYSFVAGDSIGVQVTGASTYTTHIINTVIGGEMLALGGAIAMDSVNPSPVYIKDSVTSDIYEIKIASGVISADPV